MKTKQKRLLRVRPSSTICVALSIFLISLSIGLVPDLAEAQDGNPGRIVTNSLTTSGWYGNALVMFNTDGTNFVCLTEFAEEHSAPYPPYTYRGSYHVFPSVSLDGKLAFQSCGDGDISQSHCLDDRIYVLDASGILRKLTTSEGLHIDPYSGWGKDINPVISPDGSKVCFIGKRNEVEVSPGVFEHPWTDVYVVNTDGTGLHQVTESQSFGGGYSWITSCVWNPDGSKIAFKGARLHTHPDGQTHFHVVLGTINPDGTGETHIPVIDDISWLNTSGSWSEQALDWSPDGRYILVAYGGGAQGSPVPRYLIVDLTGGGYSELTSSQLGGVSLGAGSARFSPDSQRIVYPTDKADYTAAYPTFINRDGTNKTVLTSQPFQRFNPVWWMPGPAIPAPSRLELTPNPARLFKGGPPVQVTPTLYDAGGNVIVHGVRNWKIEPNSSGSPAVSSTGVVVDRDTTQLGNFTLTATNAGLTAHTTVIVALPLLTVNRAGTGDGTVTANTGTLSCSGTSCTGTYAYDSSVTLSATPTAGSSFGGWQGCDAVSGNDCTVTMNDDRAVEATFVDTTAPVGGTLVPTVAVGQVVLQWSGFTDAVSGIESYRLVFWLGGTPGSCTGGTFLYEGTGTSYVHTGLPNGVTLYYRVCAYDRAGNGSGVTARATSLSTCTYQAAPTTQSFAGPGGGGTVTVTTQTGCPWTAVSSDPWIIITSGAGSSGSGAVGYQVLENISGGPRAGTITIGVQKLEIQQADVQTHQGIVELDTKYYNDILDRAPEQAGLDFWTGEVERIVSSGIDIKEGFIAVGKSFFNSNEYLSLGKIDTAYILDLYKTFLSRTPSQAEIDWHTSYMAQGVSRNEVLNNFIFSQEFETYVEGIFGVSTPRPENTLVNDFYRGILSRLPETGGFNYWLEQMREAQCMGSAQQIRDLSHQIALGFIQSNEYVGKGRTNGQFVEDMYDAILRRGGAPWEVNYWLTLVNTGAREQVLQGFTESNEFETRVQAVIDAGCLP